MAPLQNLSPPTRGVKFCRKIPQVNSRTPSGSLTIKIILTSSPLLKTSPSGSSTITSGFELGGSGGGGGLVGGGGGGGVLVGGGGGGGGVLVGGTGVGVSVGGMGVDVSVGMGVGVGVSVGNGVGVLVGVGVTVGSATRVLSRIGVFVGVGVTWLIPGPQAKTGIIKTISAMCNLNLVCFTKYGLPSRNFGMHYSISGAGSSKAPVIWQCLRGMSSRVVLLSWYHRLYMVQSCEIEGWGKII